MTLDALSHVTLADVKRGGGVAAEHIAVVCSVVRQVGDGFVYCIVGVSWGVGSHAMSVIVVVCVTASGAG